MRKSKSFNPKARTHKRQNKTIYEIKLSTSLIIINVNQLNSVKRQRLSHCINHNKHQLPKPLSEKTKSVRLNKNTIWLHTLLKRYT